MINTEYNYHTPLPRTLTPTQRIKESADVIIRDVGYIPFIGIIIGVPRIATGVFLKIIGGEGSLKADAGSSQIRYHGSKLTADGQANIIRGIFECLPGIGLATLCYWDATSNDRWFLYPGNRLDNSMKINPVRYMQERIRD